MTDVFFIALWSVFVKIFFFDLTKSCFLVCWLTEYKVHSYNRNGLCVLGFMDDHYPVRSAFSLLNQVSLHFIKIFSLFWSKIVLLKLLVIAEV